MSIPVEGLAPLGDSHYVTEMCRDEPLLGRSVSEMMRQVERLLVQTIARGEPFLTEPALHLLNSGGKRFRPLVTILAGLCVDRPNQNAVLTGAGAIELVHLATLHHDDVMDESTVRRQVPTVNARWNNTVAILSGDYLLMRAASLLLRNLDDVPRDLRDDCVERLYETVVTLVTGQMRETSHIDGGEEETYLCTVREKTASLIALAAWAGAALSGAPPDTVASLEQVGDRLGMVFQIADDIIDLTVPTERLGKTQGLDLREGVRTLPVIHALNDGGAASRELRPLLAEPVNDEATVARIIELIHRTNGIERAAATMGRYAEEAHTLLADLDSTPCRRAITRLIDFTATRIY